MGRKKRGVSAAAKDMLRAVWKSRSRFFAIFGIVALGAGFFCGLLSCGPDMRDTVDRYADEANMMDIQILSTLGLTDDDVAAVADVEGITGVMPGYQLDASAILDGQEFSTRFHSLPEDLSENNDNYLNRPVLLEGRWPEKDNECVLGTRQVGEQETSPIGQTITVEQEDSETGGLKETELTVVGLVKSAYYVSFTIGSTAVGNGQLDLYAYVPEGNFDQEAYTEIFATVADTKELNSFETEYEQVVDEVQERLEELGEERTVIRTDEVKDDARKELEDAQKELDDKKAEAEEQLQEAEQKLNDSEKELEEGKQQLEDGKKQLEEGKQTLEDSQKELDEGQEALKDAQWELRWGQYQYDTQLEAFNQQKQQAEDKLADAQKEIDDNKKELEEGKQQLALAQAALTETEKWISELEAQIQKLEDAGLEEEAAPLRESLEEAKALWEQGNEEVETRQQQVEEGEAQLETGQAELDAQTASVNAQFEEGQKQLDEAAAELEAGQAEIDANQQELDAGLAELEKGKQELEANEQALEDSQKEIEEGEAQLEEGWKEYNTQKADAEKELQDAQNQIDDAQQKINDIETAQWYVLDRGANMGFVSFKNDANRMDALSTVFPVIFFLVAALVALTTMTRMVEEERVIIGTYKALGYTRGRIAFKYLFYAGTATLLGCIVGPLIGFQVLPQVVWTAYQIVYSGPNMIPPYRLNYALISVGVLLVCTMGATFSACWSALREVPASLMLPKAPKAGKRILLERITPIWKRLSFTHKVTARNLFLYKRRLFMTMAGIAGCTALLLTGFGVRDSISDILDIQYAQLYKYDTTVSLVEGTQADQVESVMKDWLESPVMAVQQSGEVTDTDGETVSVYVQSPEDSAAFNELVDFRTRSGHDPVAFDDDSVVLSEKLSQITGTGVGDTLRVKVGDRWRDVTVTGVCEQYVYHYIYMGPKAYEDTFGRQEFNQILGIFTGDDRDAATDAMLENEQVTLVSFSEDTRNTFGDMLQSMNYVVLILIFCAGMLAFIVLYNLTNINITERQREIATIKVLGFYDREVSMYVYRETLMLTLLGCLAGLLLGIVLHIFVINTVEVDMVMFGRSIKPLSYVWSFLLTMLFSVLVNLVMERKLRKISMVESLKSVD